jgi:hypothetical protein
VPTGVGGGSPRQVPSLIAPEIIIRPTATRCMCSRCRRKVASRPRQRRRDGRVYCTSSRP